MLGNKRDSKGRRTALFAAAARGDGDGDGDGEGDGDGDEGRWTYDAEAVAPVWHTDQLMRRPQPRGSALCCVMAPPVGGATVFAPTSLASLGLPEDSAELARLRDTTLYVSYAHHNAAVKVCC